MRPIEDIELKNAIIESATITSEDNRWLTVWVNLDYGGSGQGFGGYALYLPKTFSSHRLLCSAGHFIWRVMEVAGVTEWSKLPGKTVRVKADMSHVVAIGHIIKDDWFDPSSDDNRVRGGR